MGLAKARSFSFLYYLNIWQLPRLSRWPRHRVVVKSNVLYMSPLLGRLVTTPHVIDDNSFKVARPSIFVGTPSIFESLRLKQIYLY